MPLQRVVLKVPEELVCKIDKAAEELFANRSEFIRQAIVAQLRELDEFRARLLAASMHTTVQTEEQILKALQSRSLGRYIRQLNRQIRSGNLQS
jgi:metal-responsive CopG/Arc/MetJ family transcriptional regulator